MNKDSLLELLGRKKRNLHDTDLVSEITNQEISLLEEDREDRSNIFLYETQDIKKIARIIILTKALNENRTQFQIAYPRLFSRVNNAYESLVRVVSSDNIRRLVDAYNLFVDRELRLKPFDDAYITLKRDIYTIESLIEEDTNIAARLCTVQRRHLSAFYSTLEDIPFEKDRLIKEKYEGAVG